MLPAYHRKRWIAILTAGVLAAGIASGALIYRTWASQHTATQIQSTVITEAARLQHKTNVIVYQACRSDTEAEKQANVVVSQLRRVIVSQALIARHLGLDRLAAHDLGVARRLPTFPPLPPCGSPP